MFHCTLNMFFHYSWCSRTKCVWPGIKKVLKISSFDTDAHVKTFIPLINWVRYDGCYAQSHTRHVIMSLTWSHAYYCDSTLTKFTDSTKTLISYAQFTPPTLTRQNCLVLSCWCWWCKVHWVGDSLWQFSVVLNISETEQFCRVLSALWTHF